MRYIEDLKPNMQINEIYLCRSRQTLTAKNGKPYDNVTLQDKTGTLNAKIWDPESPGIGDFEELDYIHVSGEISLFQGKNQLSIRRAYIAQPSEYDPNEYLPVSRYDADEMYAQLLTFCDSVENPYLKQLLDKFFRNTAVEKRFKVHSAAKSVHHGFVGGLLEHTLSVTGFCDFLAGHYEILNRDLLLTAAMLHDIGKLKELSPFPANDYTDEGQLLGHIVIGNQMVLDVIRTIDGFPKTLSAELQHCILAHHGELEFGSPKKPALAEAYALHVADSADAKMEELYEILGKVPAGDLSWQGYNKYFESNLRRTSE